MERSLSSRRVRISRRISRRLSLVSRVPGLIASRRRPHDLRRIDVTVIAPDKTQRNLVAESGQKVCEVLSELCEEFLLEGWPLVRLAGSMAEVDPGAEAVLLEAEIVIVEARSSCPPSTEGCLPVLREWEVQERSYICRIKSALPLYGTALSQLGLLAPSEFSSIFGPLQALADLCQTLADQLKETIEHWNEEEKKIGLELSSKFWEQYDNYISLYPTSKLMLREKYRSDEDFEELVRVRQGAALYSLDNLLHLPVERLSQYEEYLEKLVAEAQRERLREDEHLQAALLRAKQTVKRAAEESDLERIQDLFPNDSLSLYDRDVLTMRMKGLLRKRGSPAARLSRALSAKSLRSESPPPPRPQAHRTFIIEAPVQFTQGVQSQERHLFLFNDLLLIAKARSGGNFKLKEKVRVSEIWISTTGLEEVSELLKSRDTSFIIGWPTTNVVATFSTQAARDLWLSKLTEVVNVEKSKEPSNTNIQVTFYDQLTNIEYCKTLSVSPDETARGAMFLAVAALDLDRSQPYQLWAQSAREEAPYPLIGHERPAAIKLSCLRDALSAEEGFDLDHCNNIHDPLARCQFILRSACKSQENVEKKSPKKMVGRMRIGQVFRRSLSKDGPGCLFGLPLASICHGDALPPPILSMLQQVATKGPFTVGMFRKSANVRYVKELRSKLDAGQNVSLDSVPVLAVGALLKEFLRSLPDPLLSATLYHRWRAAMETPNLHQRLLRIKGVLEELPVVNRVLVRYVVCALVLIARRAGTNLMSPANLGVCVGPSLLWAQSPGSPSDLRLVPALVETLILHAELLCGPNVTTLLGDLRDSGTEESDSLRRDDSSIDSLECSPPPRKDKISLSRDSGLTMSDSQLYTPDEEESTSTSSSGYDPAFDQHANVSTTISVPGEYVRVYGGWEERLNPNFQRQAWFRQRSRRIHSIPSGSGEEQRGVLHSASQENLLSRKGAGLEARSASQESVLDQPPPPPPLRKPYTPALRSVRCEVIPEPAALRTVHCEVISEPRRYQYRPVYTPPKQISASTVDVSKATQARLEEEDSSTLSDDDYTPHVSRSNSRGNEVTPKLRHLPPVHVESAFLRGRLRRKEEARGPAHRSRSLPPAPPAPTAHYTNKRAPITSYYLGDSIQPHYIVTRAYRDEESYV